MDEGVPTAPDRGKPDDLVAALTRAGDALELLGEPNRWGGRPVIATVEFDGAEYVARGHDGAERGRGTLTEALAVLDPDQAERDDWTRLTR